jgi:hypothetical protein
MKYTIFHGAARRCRKIVKQKIAPDPPKLSLIEQTTYDSLTELGRMPQFVELTSKAGGPSVRALRPTHGSFEMRRPHSRHRCSPFLAWDTMSVNDGSAGGAYQL